MGVKNVSELEWQPWLHGGERAEVTFSNGYGASILRKGAGYSSIGTYELAVTRGQRLVYDTGITDDVLGHQTEEEIISVLSDIENL